jgi:imidazole glycerol-phosphate synthase subunit HisH
MRGSRSTLVFDYGIARPQRLMLALKAAGIEARISTSVQDVRAADALILPDGADDDSSLAAGIQPRVLGEVGEHIAADKPLLAIGLGVQLLLAGKTHAGMPYGLGTFKAPIARFDPRMADEAERPLKSPHVGFSFVVGLDRNPTLQDIVPAGEQGVWLYFRHRLLAPARVPFADVAVAHHGVPFAGAIWREKVLALQFLPELSGPVGLEVLQSWHGRPL